ncbi:MAG: DegT/DnrJ/EryC1/StrS family aminotransferase, partial [Bdellovibrionota bacterium]
NGNKIITTSSGGMLLTHTKEEATKALFFITQARDKAPYYLHSEIGYNYRLSNICAGIGLGQMSVIEDRVQARRNIFNIYKEILKSSSLKFIEDSADYYSNHWLSTALIPPQTGKKPSDLISYLESYNVEARHIWKPLHTQPIFKNNEFFQIESKPISEKIFDEGICLPSCSYMSADTTEQVCKIIQSFFEHN